MNRPAVRWITGSMTATLIMWATSWYFLDSLLPYDHDPTTGYYYGAAGHVHRYRQEGWGSTRYGANGVFYGDVEPGEGPWIIVWGNSYVESYPLADHAKISQLLTGELAGDAVPIAAVAVAQSGYSVSDYYHLLPRYEDLLNPIGHLIVLGRMEDVLPRGTKFQAGPDFAFNKEVRVPGWLGLRRWIDRLNLQFVWVTLRRAWPSSGREGGGGLRDMRFRPGPVTPSEEIPSTDAEELAEFPGERVWDFVIESLASQSSTPMTFVYAPRVPRVEGGTIRHESSEQIMAADFARAAADHGFGFIDLSEAFRDFFEQTGRFARGFHNGIPGDGHWNADGNRLAARAMAVYVRESFRAPQPD